MTSELPLESNLNIILIMLVQPNLYVQLWKNIRVKKNKQMCKKKKVVAAFKCCFTAAMSMLLTRNP